MNKYLHAVGFAIGLTAVIFLSGINSIFIMSDNWIACLQKPKIIYTFYILGWLMSYLATACEFGEFVIVKELRKLWFLPFLFMIFTTMSFFSCYKLHSCLIASIMLALSIVVNFISMIVMIKRTHIMWISALINVVWYVLMFGLSIIVVVMNGI